MRRVVSNICQYRYEWASWKHAAKTFAHRAIEMRHKRNEHVWFGFSPMRFEQSNRRAVIHANRELQHPQKLRTSERPALAQHGVIDILNADPGVFFDDIEGIHQLLQIGETDFPGTPLGFDNHLESGGGGTVATP